jgi:formylglycine-generating enzyme required for sulfatase activity
MMRMGRGTSGRARKGFRWILLAALSLGGCGKDSTRPDSTAPGAVQDLSVTGTTASRATLGWTAVGDDGTRGRAAGYDLRYSIQPITATNWSGATAVAGEPGPKSAGEAESFTVENLPERTVFHFALKVSDEAGNWSELSNSPSGRTKAAGDTIAPEARIFYPRGESGRNPIVNDSTDIYVGARDLAGDQREGRVDWVQFWFSRLDRPGAQSIGRASEEISEDQVPDSIRPYIDLTGGFKLYTRRWYTGTKYLPPRGTPIPSGVSVYLWVAPTDSSGNEGTSDSLQVGILNHGDFSPPLPDFTVSPQTGPVDSTFVFDPTPTTDSRFSDDQITVRWDFDEELDNGWEIDWAADRRADELQSWKYSAPGEHVVVLQARNPDLPDSVSIVRKSVIVTGQSHLGPPQALFRVTPPDGEVGAGFRFDPSLTTDRLDPASAIRVRWDFDEEAHNGWEVDWDADARADQAQVRSYATAGAHVAVLEARNTYVPDSIGTFRRTVQVREGQGEPNPDPDNFILIDPSVIFLFPMGAETFLLDGETHPADANEQPVHQVNLSYVFHIEKTEVTNRLYADYLNRAVSEGQVEVRDDQVWYLDRIAPPDSVYRYLSLSDSRILYDTELAHFSVEPGSEEHPVTGVTWYGAEAYARFYDLRLPTEAEWELAARRDQSGWSYPFGPELTAADTTRVNFADSRDPFEPGTTPAGFYNAQVYQGFQTVDTPSFFGLYDQAGNAAEWVNDWFGSYPSGNQFDPQGPFTGSLKILRGGSFRSDRGEVRCTARVATAPDQALPDAGFRTAY